MKQTWKNLENTKSLIDIEPMHSATSNRLLQGIGSCVQKASTVVCQSITLIDPWFILHWHLEWLLILIQLILIWYFTWHSQSIIGRVLTDLYVMMNTQWHVCENKSHSTGCQPRRLLSVAWSEYRQRHWSSVDRDADQVSFEGLIWGYQLTIDHRCL